MDKSKKWLISIIGFILLAAGIVAGTILVQKNQDIREKAAPATSLSFLPASQTKNPGQTVNLTIKADTGENEVTGIDIEVSFDPSVIQMTQMAATPSISNLSTIIKNGEINNTTGKARFAAFTVDRNQAVSGNLSIITLTGTILNTAVSGASQLTFTELTTIAAADEGQNVIINKTPATVTVSSGQSATSTSAPTSNPTSTPTPTAGVGGAGVTVPTVAPTRTPTAVPASTSTSTIAPISTLPPDVPVTGVSLPLIGSVSLGLLAVVFSLFLAF